MGHRTTLPITSQDHLQFYLENKISPVRQDVSNLKKHLERRRSLYRYLGIIPLLVEGRAVLEVGPGAGHNSLFVSSCLPARLDLLEPNPVARHGIDTLFENFPLHHTAPRVISLPLEQFDPHDGDGYDIVISEGWLGVSPHERKLMTKLSRFVRRGGVLAVTLASPIGMLANTLRRILGHMLTRHASAFEEKTTILLDAFCTHLETMEDMSRPYADWVQDTLLNPGFLTVHPTPEMFLEDVGKHFTIFNSFPRIHSDWRWYKSLYGDKCKFDNVFLQSYYSQCHNFFNFRELSPSSRPPDENKHLEAYCFSLLALVAEFEDRGEEIPLDRISGLIKNIRKNLASVSEEWIACIDECLVLMHDPQLTVDRVARMEKMKGVFGRELLYVSALRDDSLLSAVG